MRILRAEHLGMCFGVRDAIALALHQTRPVTILGDLVHNEIVLSQLRSQGVNIAHQVADVTTGNVMITAHGASEKALRDLRTRGFGVIEATCPLVHYAHRALQGLVRDGFYPVIIGQRDHVEVRGLTEDLQACNVVLSEQDVMDLEERPRFGIAAQTTQPIDKVRRLVSLLQTRFRQSEIRFVDTVCQPTKQRQNAAVQLARESDVVVVIGGAVSNNTRELVSTCRRFCARVHHVQRADDLLEEWFVDARVVGITAGTSTPDSVIREVEDWLHRMVRKIPSDREMVPIHQR